MTTSTRPTPEKIIGISGLQRSGKDTLAELLIKDGYYGVSLGEIVREESRIRHASSADPISVANLTETANWLRETQGADVILKIALQNYQKALQTASYHGLVLFSIRAPIEADWILAQGGALVWVEASDDIRYQRFVEHLRTGEKVISQAEYLEQEKLQWKPQPNIPVAIQMNMSLIKEKATILIENNGNDIQSFYKHAKQLIEDKS